VFNSCIPNITGVFQREHPEILAGIMVGYYLFIVSHSHLLLRSEYKIIAIKELMDAGKNTLHRAVACEAATARLS